MDELVGLGVAVADEVEQSPPNCRSVVRFPDPSVTYRSVLGQDTDPQVRCLCVQMGELEAL